MSKPFTVIIVSQNAIQVASNTVTITVVLPATVQVVQMNDDLVVIQND